MKVDSLILDVWTNYPVEMPIEEATEYVKEQLQLKPGKRLLTLSISLDGEEVILRPHYDSVVRVRRITGYLSTLPRFNDAKKDEERHRVHHV